MKRLNIFLAVTLVIVLAFATSVNAALSYTKLQQALDRVEALSTSTYTTESLNRLADAYYEGVSILDKAKSQTEIDQKTKAINDAIDALVVFKPTDKSALEVIMAAVERLDASLYTQETLNQLAKSYEKGALLILDPDAKQSDVDKAVKDIKEKYLALSVAEGIDYRLPLGEKLDACETISLSGYTLESLEAFYNAYISALNDFLNQDTDKKKLEDSYFTLSEAIENLQISDFEIDIDKNFEDNVSLNGEINIKVSAENTAGKVIYGFYIDDMNNNKRETVKYSDSDTLNTSLDKEGTYKITAFAKDESGVVRYKAVEFKVS